jgi:hypothetical protein
VSRAAHQEFERYSKARGVSRPLLCTQSFIEAKLQLERKDLLYTYFGISDSQGVPALVDQVKQRLALKKRVVEDLTRPVSYEILRTTPFEQFSSPAAIIRSVDDTSYPDGDVSGQGNSGWFRLEFFDLYHNGIEFILGIQYIIMNPNDHWVPIEYDYEPQSAELYKLKTWHIGCIPYRNIVEIDLLGDEFYSSPHFYCQFVDGNEPYEEIRYRILDEDSYPFLLPAETRRLFMKLIG